MMKMKRCCPIVVSCLLLSGCGYETLPLAKDSREPAFFQKLDQGTPVETYFCFSDWGAEPFARLVFINADGKKREKTVPITDWSWYYPEYREENPVWMTIMNSRELYHPVAGTVPRELTVISEEELEDKNANKPLEATGVPPAPQR